MKVLGVFLFLFICSTYGHPVDDGSSATCTDVTTKLVAFAEAGMWPRAAEMAGAIEAVTGIQILNADYLERFTCPWLASQSISEVGDAWQSSGYVRIEVNTVAAAAGVLYSILKQKIDSGAIEIPPKHASQAQKELMLATFNTLVHLEDMGYMNLNPDGFERMKEIVSSVMIPPGEIIGPLMPHLGNPGAYTAVRRREILLQDIQTLIAKARIVADTQWPMVIMMVDIYSGGLVDLDNVESVNSRVSELAGVDSLDSLYQLYTSTYLMPLLNFYYPQLDGMLRNLERRLTELDEHLEGAGASQEGVNAIKLKLATCTAFRAAVEATGVLHLH